jgi:hypothetical protein
VQCPALCHHAKPYGALFWRHTAAGVSIIVSLHPALGQRRLARKKPVPAGMPAAGNGRLSGLRDSLPGNLKTHGTRHTVSAYKGKNGVLKIKTAAAAYKTLFSSVFFMIMQLKR